MLEAIIGIAVIVLGILVAGLAVMHHLFEKKVAKMYMEFAEKLQETHYRSFKDGWDRGNAYGRIQALLDHQEDLRDPK